MRLLLIASGLSVLLASPLPMLRADFITPDSISRPSPGNVGSADGAPITSSADLVKNQYVSLGLLFPPRVCIPPCIESTVAITSLSGVNVWAAAQTTPGKSGPVAQINYLGAIVGALTAPTDRLAVEVIGLSGPLVAFDEHGQQIGFAFVSSKTGPNGGKLLEISASGIERFEVHGPLLFDFAPGPAPSWGIAGLSTSSLVTAPEPSSILLAMLGALGFAGPAIRSRLRRHRSRASCPVVF